MRVESGKGGRPNAHATSLREASLVKIIRNIAACIALASLWHAEALALDPAKALTQFTHSAWLMEDGLPQNSVRAIAQTADGYLWLATQAGIVRFDGVRFTVFNTSNTPALTSSNVLTLLSARDGSLWIGGYGGQAEVRRRPAAWSPCRRSGKKAGSS